MIERVCKMYLDTPSFSLFYREEGFSSDILGTFLSPNLPEETFL
jgi:hypothetical protein